jgi:hypothetical protein
VVSPDIVGRLAPAGLAILRGRLLVADRARHAVLAFEFDGTPRGAFVAPGAGGLHEPFGLAVGPRGNLFVTSNPGAVLEYDGLSGAFIRAFVRPAANAGLSQPRGLAFKPDGNLLVASFGTNELLEFESPTGRPRGPWAKVGTRRRLTRISPWGVRIGPNGNVFMSRTGEEFGSPAPPQNDVVETDPGDTVSPPLSLANAQIYEFDVRTGNFLRIHVGGADHGMRFTTGFDFVPGFSVDCNRNLLPDACDVASGQSADENNSAVPDECERDCNGNGRPDRLDLIPYGPGLDCNANLVPDECDVATAASADCNANLVPDECETLEVHGLVFGPDGPATEGMDILIWGDEGPDAVYDVAGGTLSALREGGGTAGAECLANDLPESAWAAGAVPAAGGDGFYFIVRVQTACATGSYGRDSAGNERLPAADCP